MLGSVKDKIFLLIEGVYKICGIWDKNKNFV